MRSVDQARASVARATPSVKAPFYPIATIKCEGAGVFRSQVARDVACLLDIDTSVSSWRCQPINNGEHSHHGSPDFRIVFHDGSHRYLDAPDRDGQDTPYRHHLDGDYAQLSHGDVYDGFRLHNARDLLRYGGWRTPLGDRVRLLAALDEHGSLTLAECLSAIQETRPVAGIASLILSRFVEVDLDDALLGPETIVRRIRR